MLSLRALARRRIASPLLRRCNSTVLEAASSAAPPPPPLPPLPRAKSEKTPTKSAPPAPSPNPSSKNSAPDVSESNTVGAASEDGAPKARGRRRPIVTRRPHISLEKPRQWNRPVKEGVLPAYDEALKVIEEDSARLKKELKVVLARAEELDRLAEKDDAVLAELQELRRRAGVLEIQSEINRPEVRWNAFNGMADMSKPVYRHLVEQRWRNHGALDLLMERIYQMHVVPDLLPVLRPSLDLRLTFPEPPPESTYLRTRTKRKHLPVEPGVYLKPEQTRRPPHLYASVFHPDARYYTLLLIDPDCPDPEHESFTSYLHWLQPNILLSATTSAQELQLPSAPGTHTRYLPPHPQRGSPYHRYCLFLLPHADPRAPIDVRAVPDSARRGFDLRAFCAAHGLDGGSGGGAHMWREVWDPTVSDIYRYTLKLPEPRYGRPPKPDRYEEVKTLRKFAK